MDGDQQVIQLTLDVGGETPTETSVKVSGSLGLFRQLVKGEKVQVIVRDEDGGLLAEAVGPVVAVGFKDVYKDGALVGTERSHSVKVG